MKQIFTGLVSAVLLLNALGCSNGKVRAAGPPPPPVVEVAPVIQKDVPVQGEWVGTLEGYVNAQISPQVNARIGVAKASFFPSLSLTGLGGLQSNALNRFISEPSEMWSAAFSVSQPVFQGGALRSGLKFARAQWQEAALSYRQTIHNTLGEVSNSLIAYQKNHEFREQQDLLTQAAQRSDQLSQVLYQHGGASYLQVLTNETNYFSAELNLVQAQLNERLSLVQLYQSLGGGWQQ